jgi:hypothetical protein
MGIIEQCNILTNIMQSRCNTILKDYIIPRKFKLAEGNGIIYEHSVIQTFLFGYFSVSSRDLVTQTKKLLDLILMDEVCKSQVCIRTVRKSEYPSVDDEVMMFWNSIRNDIYEAE